MVLVKILAVLSFAVTLCQGTSHQISHPRNVGGRIVEGQPAEDKQFPYEVHLWMTIENKTGECGGSLIYRQWVLTAAHCIFKATLAEVGLGSNNKWFPKEVRQSKTLFIYPEFNDVTLENDIGLIYLSEEVEISDNIRTIQIAPKNTQDLTGQMAIFSGWGKEYTESETSSDILKFIHVRIIPNTECGPFREEIICASGDDGDSCYGDSGGPLTIYDPYDNTPFLVGIVSGGIFHECYIGAPGIYTKAQFYYDWIQDTIKSVVN